MTSRDPQSDEPSAFESLGKALGGFMRELRKELAAPSAEEQQIQARVKALEDTVTQLAQEAAQNRQGVTALAGEVQQNHRETIALLEDIRSHGAAAEAAGKPGEAARWRALLKRVVEAAKVLVGPVVIAGALRDALVEDALYPPLRDRLLALLNPAPAAAPALTPPASPAPAPAPPAPAAPSAPGTPTPPEIREAAQPGPAGPARGPIRFDWVAIPAGEFLMGSAGSDRDAWNGEAPQHRVYLPRYWIARTPVTNRQFAAFVEAEAGYRTEAEKAGESSVWYAPEGRPLTAAQGDHPVRRVSWRDALAFCRWAGVRLPTEAEWEKAARGADGRLYPWGNQAPDRQKHCNYDDHVGSTTPVGSYPAGASPYGVLDMAGNVWEWTNSLYRPYPYRADDGREGTGEGSRVLRGGAFNFNASLVRCAVRCGDFPYSRNWYFGFRVVASPIIHDSGG